MYHSGHSFFFFFVWLFRLFYLPRKPTCDAHAHRQSKGTVMYSSIACWLVGFTTFSLGLKAHLYIEVSQRVGLSQWQSQDQEHEVYVQNRKRTLIGAINFHPNNSRQWPKISTEILTIKTQNFESIIDCVYLTRWTTSSLSWWVSCKQGTSCFLLQKSCRKPQEIMRNGSSNSQVELTLVRRFSQILNLEKVKFLTWHARILWGIVVNYSRKWLSLTRFDYICPMRLEILELDKH